MSSEDQLAKLRSSYSNELADEILNDFHKQLHSCALTIPKMPNAKEYSKMWLSRFETYIEIVEPHRDYIRLQLREYLDIFNQNINN